MDNKYFISFSFKNVSGEFGVGNTEITTDFIIKGIGDIKKIEKSMLENNKGFENITITNFILM